MKDCIQRLRGRKWERIFKSLFTYNLYGIVRFENIGRHGGVKVWDIDTVSYYAIIIIWIDN